MLDRTEILSADRFQDGAVGLLSERRFLIVSAPFGPFGGVLTDALRRRGASVSRIILNAGDQASWGFRSGGLVYRGTASQWPERLAAWAEDATDVVVFGEAGPYNRAALALPPKTGRRLWVMENGYFRPDWITLERNGANASTSLPSSPDGYDQAPEVETPIRHIGRILPHHVVNITLHHLIQVPGRLLFPHYAPSYMAPAWIQCAGHIGHYARRLFRSRQAEKAETLSERGPFFLVCLQREGDAQLLRYARLADNTAFLGEVLTSFSLHAPPDKRLVIKNHPLDPGLIDLRRATRSLAIERGVADRVDFIDGGNLAQLCRASQGLVVNNSSAALSALGFGTPVKLLGRAFFNFEGLADQQPLSAFWRNPVAPDQDLFERFRRVVISRTQINGSYHAPHTIRATAERLCAALEDTTRQG